MTTAVRVAIAVVVLLGVVMLARNQVAWAGNQPVQGQAVARQEQVAPAVADAKPGSVKPPPVVVPPITKPGNYSVGGVCTVIVDQIVSTVTLHVNLLPFDSVHNRPVETKRYLAGVCQVKFVMSGKGVTDVTPQDATVKICFAAIPNTTDNLYVYDDHSWFPLDTTVQNGLACAPATKTGKYVLVQMP